MVTGVAKAAELDHKADLRRDDNEEDELRDKAALRPSPGPDTKRVWRAALRFPGVYKA